LGATSTAVVTGAGLGLGRGIALRLARDGFAVAAIDVDLDAAADSVEQIIVAGGAARHYRADVGDPEAVQKACGDILHDLGAVKVVVNCAGWDEVHPFVETDPAFWEHVIRVNYLGVVAVSHAFVKPMIEAGDGGRIVNISSDAGRVGSTGETVYAGAKGAIIAFTKSLAREMVRHRITVNCVCPGPANTRLFRRQPERIQEALLRAIPFRRLAEPADVAHAVSFFASDGAGYITGQVLSVSGGLTMAG
jgi:2-hydroxycyclohexanecarboxyl-CoA dehydrogenase